MSARKKPGPAKPRRVGVMASSLGAFINDLRQITEYMEAARKGIAANYYCRDLAKLEAGLKELNRIISQLELAREVAL